jgi:hypothetical protein
MWGLALDAEVVVSPPFVFLQQTKGLLRLDFAVAAQNCWVRKGGAFTGEIRSIGSHLTRYYPLCVSPLDAYELIWQCE